MPRTRSLPGFLMALAVSAFPTAGEAQVAPSGASFAAISMGVRGSSVAFDSRNRVYLTVGAYGTVRGRVVSASGALVGADFQISTTGAFAHYPRVRYSPDADAGRGAFLVVWHEGTGSNANFVKARLVSATAGLLGSELQLGTEPSWWEAAPALEYSTVSGNFLVVWQITTYRIRGARVSAAGALLDRLVVTSDVLGTGERDPSVAYNPATDQYLVAYTGWGGGRTHASARLLSAATGALSTPQVLSFGTGSYISDASFSPATGTYMVAWFQIPGGILGRVVGANGIPAGSVIPLSTRFGTYDSLGLAYNRISGTYAMVGQDVLSVENGAVEISAAGNPGSAGVVTSAGGPYGNFYPQVAASTTSPQWMLSTAHNFNVLYGQLIVSGSSGGTSPPQPPPPPPPPAAPAASCAVEPHPSNTTVSLTSAAQTRGIAVTASTAGCAWTASSATSWITIAAGASGAGPGTVTLAVARNTSGVARTGTVTVAGGAVTVQQGASLGNAALHDITGEGGSDLMWHNVSTGRVAVWGLAGHTVTSTYYLTPAGVDTNWKVEGTGDLNGDGYADLVWRHAAGAVACWSLTSGQIASTQYVTMNGANASERDPMWQIRAVGDLDGDGKSDIVWQNMGVGTLRVWFMDGFVVRSSAVFNLGMPDWSWKIAGAGDLNADGKADIIWQNDSTGGLGAWLMDGNQVVGQSNLSIERVPDLNWKVRGVGDTNGDGFADMLWQHAATGEVAVWYLNRFSVIGTGWLSIRAVTDLNWRVVGPG